MAKKIRKNKSLIYSALGVLIGGAIGGGAVAIYLSLKDDGHKKPIIDYKFEKIWLFKNSDGSYDKSSPIIEEANIIDENVKTENPIYWLGDKGLELLRRRLIEELSYGPEIYQIPKIVIGDENMISVDNNGHYTPFTHEIYINTKNFRRMMPYYADINDSPLTLNTKVDLALNVIEHEYLHHLADSYMNSEPLGHPSIDGSTYFGEWGKEKKQSPWNKNFLTRFKAAFHYDKHTELYPEKGIITFGSGGHTNANAPKYNSLGSIYDAKDLFDAANDKVGNLDKLKVHPGSEGYILSSINSERIPSKAINEEMISYLYSIDELFVRKYQLLLSLFKHEGTKGHVGQITEDGYILAADGHMWSHGLSLDNQNIQEHFEDYNKRSASDLKGWLRKDRFLMDSPFNQNLFEENGLEKGTSSSPEDIYNILDEQIGHKSGDDISYLWTKNDSRLTQEGTIATDFKNKEIKFGGYIPLGNTFKYVGYSNNGSMKWLPIVKKNFHLQMKEYVNSNHFVPLDNTLENEFYVLKDFVNADEIKGKKLYFAGEKIVNKQTVIDSDNKVALTTVRGSNEHGYASSYSWSTRNYTNSSIMAKKVHGGVILEDKEWV